MSSDRNSRTEKKGKVRWPQPKFGHLQVKYSNADGWRNYDIIETDYSNYAVVYTCQTTLAGARTEEEMQVLVRQPAEQGTKLWKAYEDVSFSAIKRGFIEPEIGRKFIKMEQSENSDSKHLLYSRKQGGDFCLYPIEEGEAKKETA